MGNKAIKFKNKDNDYIYPCPYYPVGSVYISVTEINPSTFFGGTWEQIKDKFLLACGNTYKNATQGAMQQQNYQKQTYLRELWFDNQLVEQNMDVDVIQV